MDPQVAARSLAALGSNLEAIARELGALLCEDEGVPAGTHHATAVGSWTVLYTHPDATAHVIADAVVAHAARRWRVALDVAQVSDCLIGAFAFRGGRPE